jgi:hypothetical protein
MLDRLEEGIRASVPPELFDTQADAPETPNLAMDTKKHGELLLAMNETRRRQRGLRGDGGEDGAPLRAPRPGASAFSRGIATATGGVPRSS